MQIAPVSGQFLVESLLDKGAEPCPRKDTMGGGNRLLNLMEMEPLPSLSKAKQPGCANRRESGVMRSAAWPTASQRKGRHAAMQSALRHLGHVGCGRVG